MLLTVVYVSFLQGHIKPLSQQVLTIKYLPFGPKKFHTSFQIQVSLVSFSVTLYTAACLLVFTYLANFTIKFVINM